MRVLGFTGRASDMTSAQERALRAELASYDPAEWKCLHNNGDGADQVFDAIAVELGFNVGMTPNDLNPMPRNRELVARADALIAVVPTEEPLKSGSGTWATVKYMQKAGKPVTIIKPE